MATNSRKRQAFDRFSFVVALSGKAWSAMLPALTPDCDASQEVGDRRTDDVTSAITGLGDERPRRPTPRDWLASRLAWARRVSELRCRTKFQQKQGERRVLLTTKSP